MLQKIFDIVTDDDDAYFQTISVMNDTIDSKNNSKFYPVNIYQAGENLVHFLPDQILNYFFRKKALYFVMVSENKILKPKKYMMSTSHLPAQKKLLLTTLQSRFEHNKHRHPAVDWADVYDRLEKSEEKWLVLYRMEETGGEPDVVLFDDRATQIVFCDCSAESPKGRRSLCYDETALAARKEYKPKDSALNMAATLGITLLTEVEYRKLQTWDVFDVKTSSWVFTPAKIRDLGGALFCDRRYDTVFTYHNGAESYYAARGFRGKLTI